MSGLFDEQARRAAAGHARESPFRWLALSEDPGAASLRAALERGHALAGRAARTLAAGLAHERWGQHMGALAHLLALAWLDDEGFEPEAEPELGAAGDGARAPDALARRGALSMLLEIRAITGAGDRPWEERRLERRTLAATPERHAALAETVAQVLLKKSARYRDLAARHDLPFVVLLYEDLDDEIAPLVRLAAFGRAHDGADGPRDARGGLFDAQRDELAQLSGVVVLRRVDDDSGALRLSGDLVDNPCATRPLPDELFPRLRRSRRDGTLMRAGFAPGPFALR